MKIKRQKDAKLIILSVVGGVLLVGLVTTLVLSFSSRLDTAVVDEPRNDPEPEPPAPDPVAVSGEMKLLMAGTTFWGRRTNKLARAGELGVKYPFSQLDTLNREAYDAWIAGLECPITDRGHNYAEENTIFKFNCDPDYLDEAKNWFTAFLLGNNHTDNQGPEGFEATKAYLSAAGIQYFGHYDRNSGTENCGVVVLPLRAKYDDGSETKISMPLAFCSAHGVYGIPSEAAFLNIKRHAEILPTIAMPHMGAEYQSSADALRTNLYRKMIDYGAEMVIADHPHWIQNTEAYNGRLIAYSMGNFMFDQGTAETVRSAAIEVTASVDKSFDFSAWDALGVACLADKSTCLDGITAAGLEKPQINWTFGYKGTTSAGDTITRLAPEAEQISIGERLNWAATLSGLASPSL